MRREKFTRKRQKCVLNLPDRRPRRGQKLLDCFEIIKSPHFATERRDPQTHDLRDFLIKPSRARRARLQDCCRKPNNGIAMQRKQSVDRRPRRGVKNLTFWTCPFFGLKRVAPPSHPRRVRIEPKISQGKNGTAAVDGGIRLFLAHRAA